MKKSFILIIMLVSVLALGYSQQTVLWNVDTASAWIEAVNGIRNGSNNITHTIIITGSFPVIVTPSSEFTFGSITGITVTIEGNGIISPAGNGSLLRVGNGQVVNIRDITMRGRENNNTPVVVVGSGGT